MEPQSTNWNLALFKKNFECLIEARLEVRPAEPDFHCLHRISSVKKFSRFLKNRNFRSGKFFLQYEKLQPKKLPTNFETSSTLN